MTRAERLAALICVLRALGAVLLSGCAVQPLPAQLPHYPCERVEDGRTVYFACGDQEWLHQQITRPKSGDEQ